MPLDRVEALFLLAVSSAISLTVWIEIEIAFALMN